jgi:hypothetical protein
MQKSYKFHSGFALNDFSANKVKRKVKAFDISNLKTKDVFKLWRQALPVVIQHWAEGSKESKARSILLLDQLSIRLCRLSDRGDIALVKYIKGIRTLVHKYIAGEQLPKLSMPISVNRMGLPKILSKEIIILLKAKDINFIRMLLTTLQVTYLIKGMITPDSRSITEECTANDETFEAFNVWASTAILELSKDVKKQIYWDKPHYTEKNGPNGKALNTLMQEVKILPPQLKEDIKILGGPKLDNWINQLVEFHSFYDKQHSIIFPLVRTKSKFGLRKLTYIASPEMKARGVASFDYFSQTALLGLHKWSFDVLRQLKSDMTFSQNAFISLLGNGPYFCFDLTAFTDRLPIKIQQSWLVAIIGEERSKAWQRIMVNIPFYYQDQSKYLHYNCGQPMGAYSSWGIATITHHLIVRYCAKLEGINPDKFNRYFILGDDLCILDKKVAVRYKTIINSFGVQINDSKSLVSQDTIEFAKRLFIHKREITGFPLSAMLLNANNASGLWSTCLTARERNFKCLHVSSIPAFVLAIQNICGTKYNNSFNTVCFLESINLLGKPKFNSENFSWALDKIHYLLDRPKSCSTNLKFLYDELVPDLARYLTRVRLDFLDDAYKVFLKQSDQLMIGHELYLNQITPSIRNVESCPPIDQIPAIMLFRSEMATKMFESQKVLQSLAGMSFIDIISGKVMPMAKFRKTISFQSSIKPGAIPKYLREVKKLQLRDELNASSTLSHRLHA